MRFELVVVAVGPRTALWGLIPENVVIAIPGLLFQRDPWRWLSWLDQFQSRVVSSLLARQTGRINRRVVEVGEFQKATKPITDFVCQGATWVERQLGRVNNTSNLLKFELTRFHRDQPLIATQTNFLKFGPTATTTSSRRIGQPLTKICRNWRNIPWFLDWVWISFLGFNNAQVDRNLKLVQAVSRLQPSSPRLPRGRSAKGSRGEGAPKALQRNRDHLVLHYVLSALRLPSCEILLARVFADGNWLHVCCIAPLYFWYLISFCLSNLKANRSNHGLCSSGVLPRGDPTSRVSPKLVPWSCTLLDDK